MIPVISLSENLTTSDSGKAWRLLMSSPKSERVSVVWIPVSQSQVKDGILYVAEWLLTSPNSDLSRLVSRGFQVLQGTLIDQKVSTVAPMDSVLPKTSGAVAKGFFTVQGDGQHRTFRFKTSKAGKTAIGLMTGSNNLTDYVWFGYLDDTTIKYWKNPRDKYFSIAKLPIGQEIISECINAILGNADEAGLRYAKEYKNCSRCGRVLTNPESLAIGLGAECAGMKYGRH